MGQLRAIISQCLLHFTSGFAEGFTAPFTLPAGLPLLERIQPAIYAGLAENCAGRISLDISGCLAAKGGTAARAEIDDYGQRPLVGQDRS
ncbi:hypothetical protein GGS23DRAFT_566290 [Durotheca rogersii]|uniref:uncharacterized protein n=1 Tax=Durotheca rogersii TaxID=419775 RepID=UPI00221FD584|nr:uncharacterized protein GGS23DRAFT_566290 [Durotheca rogersii]KAI5863300.1 hypothetical protein GGS23DRAFT_566290 [Durotheca rogersii]